MKRIALLVMIAFFASGLAMAEEPAKSSCKPENFKIENLAELPAWVTDGGFKVRESQPQDQNLFSCPISLCPVQICINPTGTCEGANCSTSDTGQSSCSLGQYTFQCPSGQTIQQTSCSVCECPNGSVCSSSGSSSISCG